MRFSAAILTAFLSTVPQVSSFTVSPIRSYDRYSPEPGLSNIHSIGEHEFRNSIILHMAKVKGRINNIEKDINMSEPSSENEMKRIKFQLNQLKGDMEEARLRANAAERRVLILKKQQELESKEVDTEKDDKEKNELKKQVENFMKKN